MTIAAPMHAGLVLAVLTVRGLGHHSLCIGPFLDPPPAFKPLYQRFRGLPVVGCVVDIALIAVDSAGRQSHPGQTFSPLRRSSQRKCLRALHFSTTPKFSFPSRLGQILSFHPPGFWPRFHFPLPPS